MFPMLMLNNLRRKEKEAKELIEKVLSENKSAHISSSWGKDSTVVTHLVHSIDPTVPVVFMDSGYNMPDTYVYRDLCVSEMQANYYEVECPQDYLEMIREYGLPGIDRKQSDHDKAIKTIKSSPIDNFAESMGFDCTIWGIRADETRGRRHLLAGKGLYYTTKDGKKKASPIGWWTAQEVWQYIDAYNIPYNGLYDKVLEPDFTRNTIKNSGWLTTDKARKGRIVWLKMFYPELYQELKQISKVIDNYL